MVGHRALNRYRIRQLVDNRLLELYRIIVKQGDLKVLISKRQVESYIVKELLNAGYSLREVANATGIKVDFIKRVAKRKSITFSKKFKASLRLFNPIFLFKKADKYDCDYTIYKEAVEYLIIEDLLKARWTTKQVQAATGFYLRRIQRVKKRLENEDD